MDSTEIIVNDCIIAHQWTSSLTPSHSLLLVYAHFYSLASIENANIIAMKILFCPLERPHAGIHIHICAGIFVYARSVQYRRQLAVQWNVQNKWNCYEYIGGSFFLLFPSLFFGLHSFSFGLPSVDAFDAQEKLVFFFRFFLAEPTPNILSSTMVYLYSLNAYACLPAIKLKKKWFASAHRHKLTSLF